MLFVVISDPNLRKAKESIERSREYADGFEFRLDLMEDISPSAIRSLMKRARRPILLTLRLASFGGAFEGSELERQKIYLKLLELEPDYVDLELSSNLQWAEEISQKFPQVQIIISYHNYERTPESLGAIFEKMQKYPAKIFKIAARARSIIDSLRILDFIKSRSEEGHSMIGIGMGEKGEVTRILGTIFGSMMHFATSDETKASAPGQLTAKTLCETYHFKRLGPRTLIYGLIGFPVRQSPSHAVHNALIRELSLNAIYVKFLVEPGELALFLSMVKKMPVRGLSVTIPLKEEVASLVDEVGEDAREIGAINTLIFQRNGTLLGENTDSVGALDALEKISLVEGKKILLLGAGGSARAIAYEAIRRGGIVTVLNRTKQRAEALAKELGCRGKGSTNLGKIGSVEEYHILINTTSVGMYPNDSASPLRASQILPRTTVMDIIMAPRDTRLLKEAAQKECMIVYGKEMFLLQASLQFRHWLGAKVAEADLLKLLETAFSKQEAIFAQKECEEEDRSLHYGPEHQPHHLSR